MEKGKTVTGQPGNSIYWLLALAKSREEPLRILLLPQVGAVPGARFRFETISK
jgi:hypothetical protein